MLEKWLWDGVFLHPWTISWRCVSQRQQVSLWGHLAFSDALSPLPAVACHLWSPRHMCISLEQYTTVIDYSRSALVFSVFKVEWEFHLLNIWQLNKMPIYLGETWMKSVFSNFPRTNEKLAEISTKLGGGETGEQIFTQHSWHQSSPAAPWVRNCNTTPVFNMNLTPTGKLGFSYLNSMHFN